MAKLKLLQLRTFSCGRIFHSCNYARYFLLGWRQMCTFLIPLALAVDATAQNCLPFPPEAAACLPPG